MSDLESYLKNLEALLGGGAAAPAPAPAPAATTAPATQPLTAVPASATNDKIRFMLVSTHIQQVTGYAKVSYGLLKQLAVQPNIETIHFGFQKFQGAQPVARTYPAGITEIDAASYEDPKQPQLGFAFSELPNQIARHKPHVVMIYNDMNVVNGFIEAIKKSGVERNFQLWIYVDQVYTVQAAQFIDVLNREADRVFAFTRYWRDVLKSQGVHRPIDVIHHGFDTDIFRKIPKEEARRLIGLPPEMFLITSFNRNQPRKRLDIMIIAFVELLVKYPTKPIAMLCVCDKGEKGGWPLFEIFVRELKARGVKPEVFGNRLIVTTKDMSYKDEDINVMYCAGDVGIATAEGEGWGLCTFEQMGLGVPQVAPDVGGYKEFCKEECSVLVKPKWRYYQTMTQCPVGGEAWVCDPHDVCLALEKYVLDSDMRRRHGEAATQVIAKYTWADAVRTLVRRLEQAREDLADV
jgi:glycosyltransferase involved in cell wall biosynthesis